MWPSPWVAILVGLVLCSAGASAVAAGVERPPAPEGFAWQEIDEIKAAFLVPAGWHFTRKQEGGTLAYFITREDPAELGIHETGLTINAFVKLETHNAVEYAEQFIGSTIAAGELVDSWRLDTGLLQGHACLTHNVADDGTSFTKRSLAIGNSNTNTLYLMWFESPEQTWDSVWKIGEVMLSVFALDSEI
jgi:hypothetical protein